MEVDLRRMTQATWRSDKTAPKMPRGHDRANSLKINLNNERLWSIGGGARQPPQMKSLATRKPSFWQEAKQSPYQKDTERNN